MYYTIRHICRVAACPARHVARHIVVMPSARTAVQEAYIPWKKLNLATLASLKTEEQIQNGQRLTKAQLTAPLLCRAAGFAGEPTCLLLTDDAGSHWLFGTGSAPYPLITNHISSAEGKARETVEALWETPMPLCQLIKSEYF
ncbi:MAG: hypothetical protein IKO20_05105 [Bacteroidaceae bacterium]|nr:hypothetical protein [Bacteroidaceae bacterium]